MSPGASTTEGPAAAYLFAQPVLPGELFDEPLNASVCSPQGLFMPGHASFRQDSPIYRTYGMLGVVAIMPLLAARR
jgi:hypothetical protein